MTIEPQHIVPSSLNPQLNTLTAPPQTSADYTGRASVLVPLMDEQGQWQLLLTLRSSHLRLHGGEVAFPGGMWEPTDQHLLDTALRESEEEIGLATRSVKVLGGLDEMQTRRKTRVQPIVGVIPANVALQANCNEIEAIFKVPLAFFKQDKRLRTDIFIREIQGKRVEHWAPAYQFGQYEIWGFTATVIVQLMKCCFSVTLPRDNRAPEKRW